MFTQKIELNRVLIKSTLIIKIISIALYISQQTMVNGKIVMTHKQLNLTA